MEIKMTFINITYNTKIKTNKNPHHKRNNK